VSAPPDLYESLLEYSKLFSQMNRNPLNEEGIALEAFGKEEKTPSP